MHHERPCRAISPSARGESPPNDGKFLPLPIKSEPRLGRLHGGSIAMRRLFSVCRRLAESRVPVLIEGETGTGKELVAEAIYEIGGSRGPFVVFDCAAVSPHLMEAELFGHERGAFTGATTQRRGIFEEAHGGTILIDEIGDLAPTLQAKLLRVLDRGEIRRVGGTEMIHVDVRVLAATRRDLDGAIAAGQFRDDLFHRLAVARLEVPPLRHRAGDVSLLARHFALEHGTREVPADAIARFEDYAWPGNVRELRNAVSRWAALGESDPSPEAFRAAIHCRPSRCVATDPDWLDSVLALPFAVARRKMQDEFARRYVERVLEAHEGNMTEAARASGLALRYFRKVKSRARR
jgi:transcriptional regulator with GAF, ATPase, and Fis domain